MSDPLILSWFVMAWIACILDCYIQHLDGIIIKLDGEIRELEKEKTENE